MQPLCMCNGKWRRAEVLCKQPPQMAAGYAESIREFFNRTFVQRSIGNQPQATTNRRGRAAPRRGSRRTLWSTAQAGTQTGLRGRCCTRKEGDVPGLGGNGRADGPAIDACRPYSDEKLSVESRVPRKPGSLVYFVLLHAASIRSVSELTGHNRTSTYRGRPCTCI